MYEKKENLDKEQNQEVKLKLDLPDVITEAYAKAFLAYRISLENWFLLNKILAFIKNEKLPAEEVQKRLQKLFSVINSEVIQEMVRLNQVAEAKEKANKEEEKVEAEETEKK